MSNIYPIDITDEEKKLGFKTIVIESDYQSITGQPEMWKVVAKRLSEADYLFKVEGGYKHMRFGHRETDKSGKNPWFPMGHDVYPFAQIGQGEKIVQKKGFQHIIEADFEGGQ